METKKERLESQRQIIAERLKECLDIRNMTQANLLEKTKRTYHLSMTRAQLSQTIHGKRTLQPDFARKFAKVLGVKAGYLLGADDFRFNTYDEYVEMYDDFYGEEYKRELSELHKYDYILNMAGFTVIGMDAVNDNVTGYTIKKRGKTADIPAERMEQLYNDICAFVKKSVDPLMDIFEVNNTEE